MSDLNAAEIGGVRMRKKSRCLPLPVLILAIAWATAIDVISAFLITFSFLYLLGTPGANLKAKVGWIMAGLAVLSFIFAGLFVPELANRSLEEVDELFGVSRKDMSMLTRSASSGHGSSPRRRRMGWALGLRSSRAHRLGWLQRLSWLMSTETLNTWSRRLSASTGFDSQG